MTHETIGTRHLRPGAGPHNDQHPTKDANNSVRRTAADVQAELAATVARAQKLVEQIAGQAEAEQREFNLGYQLGFAAGADVGERRALLLQEQQAAAQAQAVNAFSRTRTLETHEQIGQVRYPGYTPAQLRVLRAPNRIIMPTDRPCIHCDGHGVIFGRGA